MHMQSCYFTQNIFCVLDVPIAIDVMVLKGPSHTMQAEVSMQRDIINLL